MHYGWVLFPPEWQAQVWNISGSIARLALLAVVLWRVRSWPVLAVGAWWAAEEMMVAGCSLAWIIDPWVVPAGQSQCQALMQMDVGRVGLLIMVAVLAATVNAYSVKP